MRATLKTQSNPVNTYGELTVYDDSGKVVYTCKSLELPWKDNQRKISCIPAGIYKVVKEAPKPHFDYIHWRVLNVPGRDGILIHKANYVDTKKVELQGCIALGLNYVDMDGDGIKDLSNCTPVFNHLAEIMPDEWVLTIERAGI